jgi:hypothetical protein
VRSYETSSAIVELPKVAMLMMPMINHHYLANKLHADVLGFERMGCLLVVFKIIKLDMYMKRYY